MLERWRKHLLPFFSLGASCQARKHKSMSCHSFVFTCNCTAVSMFSSFWVYCWKILPILPWTELSCYCGSIKKCHCMQGYWLHWGALRHKQSHQTMNPWHTDIRGATLKSIDLSHAKTLIIPHLLSLGYESQLFWLLILAHTWMSQSFPSLFHSSYCWQKRQKKHQLPTHIIIFF